MFEPKPFLVEFSGTPEAGKTTAIRNVAKILESRGYKVIIQRESAEILPEEIPKGSFDANMWMHFMTQAELMKVMYSKADIILSDRGVMDTSCFAYKFFRENACTKEQYEQFLKMVLSDLFPNLFIAFIVSPKEAIRRRGGEGRIVNEKYVRNYNNIFIEYYNNVCIPKMLFTTDHIDAENLAKMIAKILVEKL